MAHPFSAAVDVPVSGGSLRVGLSGPPPGSGVPVVVAVHGITGSHRSWSPVARHLGDSVSLLALDLRGRGGSSEVSGPFGMDVHAADVAAVLDHFGVARAVLTGHSMGAYVVARLAAKAPERVVATLLVDGGLPLPVPPDLDPDVVLAAILGPALDRLSMKFDSLADYQDFWRAHPAFTIWTDDVADYIAYDCADPAASPVHSRVAADAVRADGRDLLAGDAATAALAALPGPTVLLWAPRGLQNEPRPLLPPAVIEAGHQACPHLLDQEIADTNHYLILLGDREARVVAAEIRRLAEA